MPPLEAEPLLFLVAPAGTGATTADESGVVDGSSAVAVASADVVVEELESSLEVQAPATNTPATSAITNFEDFIRSHQFCALHLEWFTLALEQVYGEPIEICAVLRSSSSGAGSCRSAILLGQVPQLLGDQPEHKHPRGDAAKCNTDPDDVCSWLRRVLIRGEKISQDLVHVARHREVSHREA